LVRPTRQQKFQLSQKPALSHQVAVSSSDKYLFYAKSSLLSSIKTGGGRARLAEPSEVASARQLYQKLICGPEFG
jgi:hypothetical protein